MKELGYIISAAIVLAGCGNGGYEEIVPGLKVKKIETGKERGMQNGSDYFYLSAHVLDESDKPFDTQSFNPNFFYLEQLKKPSYTYDFAQALPTFKKGDSLSFATYADSLFLFYYGAPAPAELAGKGVHLHVKVVNIMDEEEYYQRLELARETSRNAAYEEFESYLHNHNITTPAIGTGTVKVTLVNGNGQEPYYKDVVAIHMVQKTLNGIEIENSRKGGGPFEYEIGSQNGLKGLDEALIKMKKGEKAMVYLPFFLAFGESGNPPTVAPYTNIMMELELVDILKPE